METEFQIKIYYKTGDSFHIEDAENLIDYTWKNLKGAQASIKHIENHNKFYMEHNNLYSKPKGKLPDGVAWDKEFRIITLKLVDDNGNLFDYASFWTGYFDELKYAEIVIKESPLSSYRPSHY